MCLGHPLSRLVNYGLGNLRRQGGVRCNEQGLMFTFLEIGFVSFTFAVSQLNVTDTSIFGHFVKNCTEVKET